VAALPAEARSARPLGRRGFEVVRCGVGTERARAAAERLVASGCRRLLVWGTAAGLDPELDSGALLVPERVVASDGSFHPVDPMLRRELLAALPAGLTFSGAPLASCAAPLAGAADKIRLRSLTGAGGADMETAGVAAAAAGASWAVVRAVVDPAGWTLPSVVVDGSGALRSPSRIVLALALRPGETAALLRLARAYRRACRSLRSLARALAAAERP
jgi:adenosylhomocysteine nucleosidase